MRVLDIVSGLDWARIRLALPVYEALLPVACQRADLACLGHAAQGVVSAVRNHDVAGRVHSHAGRQAEAHICSLAVLKARLLLLVPREGGKQPRGRDQAGAVGQHKKARGLTQPGQLEGGHGGVECGGARAWQPARSSPEYLLLGSKIVFYLSWYSF